MTRTTPSEFQRAVAARLREWRGNRSQGSVAASLKVTQTNWSRYERGSTFPNPYLLHVLATEQGLDIYWLYTGVVHTAQEKVEETA